MSETSPPPSPLKKIPPEPGSAVREVLSSFTEIMRAEAGLMRAEMKESAHGLQNQLIRATLFGFLAGTGFLPLLSFVVIGLGKLLDENYWLSSLIVGLALLLLGGRFALRSFRAFRNLSLELPETRESVNYEVRRLEKKFGPKWRKTA